MLHDAQGKHVLIDLYEASHLTDIDYIASALREAAALCGATVLDVHLHSFGHNQGITGVAILAESHISIHTWPECQFAAIDIFMCGNCDPDHAIKPIQSAFESTNVVVSRHRRGGATPTDF